MRWLVDCTRKCNADVVTKTTRDDGKSFWYPVVYLATCRGDAFIHDVSRMRLGSFVMDALDGLILSGGARYKTVGESSTKPKPYGFGAATAFAILSRLTPAKKSGVMVGITENSCSGKSKIHCPNGGVTSGLSFPTENLTQLPTAPY